MLDGPSDASQGWSREDRKKILTYCEGDVIETAQLFSKMKDSIDLPRATLRGQYSYALARVERIGYLLMKNCGTS